MDHQPVLIVLAGGASSRMWPIREKSLLRFGAEPLLVAQLRRSIALGLQHVIVVANPDSQAEIRAAVAQIEGAHIQVVVQPEPRGMGDAILRAAPLLPASAGQPLFITQVHDVVDDTLHAHLLRAFAANPRASYLAGVEMDDYFPGGYLIVDDNGRISGIVEKPGADNRPSRLVNIVAHVHRDADRLMQALQAEYDAGGQSDDHYERAMDRLMKSDHFQVVAYRGPWAALKFPWHVLDVMNAFLARISGQQVAASASIAPTASLVGNVFIGEGARVFPGAAVVGPAYIGAGTIVGNNALVRASMVLDRCEVGFTTEIARSYVAEHVSMHACRVLDSVFLPRVNFSAGCTTANLRMDRGEVSSAVKGQKLRTGRDKFGAVVGADSFLSVDVMTMPGVKIGARVQVGPGVHVTHDIADEMRMFLRQDIVIRARSTDGEQ
jgi:bifunctional UDP-N-acetylglucosamine pyrophosphorylase/glucosamine-1-phosphate N-acetyltransferase